MKSPLSTTATVTKTLGHPGRLRILAVLAQGEVSVCQIAAATKLPVSTTSGLLLELKQAGLVGEERRGRWVFYFLIADAPARALLDVVLPQVEADPQVRKDITAVRRLRGRSPDVACTSLGLPRVARRQS